VEWILNEPVAVVRPVTAKSVLKLVRPKGEHQGTVELDRTLPDGWPPPTAVQLAAGGKPCALTSAAPAQDRASQGRAVLKRAQKAEEGARHHGFL